MDRDPARRMRCMMWGMVGMALVIVPLLLLTPFVKFITGM